MNEDEGIPCICKQIFTEVCVLANGDVVCSSADVSGQNVLGNIYQNHIYEIFDGKEYNDLRERILRSEPDAYCPILKFNCCYKTLPNQTKDIIPRIETIMLETTSYCNLRCPPCPERIWSEVHEMIGYHPRIAKLHDDKIREILLDTKDTLKLILLYNYGEPFLDKRLLHILTLAKDIIPGVQILTSTNGTIIPEGWAETIVREGLIDHITFSIDGASQETYGKYRIGGSFDNAFNNMVDMVKFKSIYKKSKPEVIWQYILFEWNDSEAELKRALALATKYGLKIVWVITSCGTPSRIYTSESNEWKKLQGIKGCEAGIRTPGHGKRYDRSNHLKFVSGLLILSKSSYLREVWMAFSLLGERFTANGLILTVGLLIILIFLFPIPWFIKIALIFSCLVSIRIYRKSESEGLRLLFKDVLSRNPKSLREYIQAFIDVREINNETLTQFNINSICNGKFKKLLLYNLVADQKSHRFNFIRYNNMINRLLFLSCPIPDSIMNEELKLYSLECDLLKRGHYGLISGFAKKYSNSYNKSEIYLLYEALCGLGYNLELPLLRRMILDLCPPASSGLTTSETPIITAA